MTERVVRCLIKFLQDIANKLDIEEITDDHWLLILFDAVFQGQPAFGNVGPLDEDDQKLLSDLKLFSRTKKTHEKARKAAQQLADILDLYLHPQGLHFDDQSLSVIFDGVKSGPLEPLAYALLKLLSIEAGSFVTTSHLAAKIDYDNFGYLSSSVHGQIKPFKGKDVAAKKRFYRASKLLPPSLRALIESKPRLGWRFIGPT